MFLKKVWDKIFRGHATEWATVVSAAATVVIGLYTIFNYSIMKEQCEISDKMKHFMMLQEIRDSTQDKINAKRALRSLYAELRINVDAARNDVLSRPLLDSSYSSSVWAMDFAEADPITMIIVGQAYITIQRAKEASRGWHTLDSVPASLECKDKLGAALYVFNEDKNIQEAMAYDPEKK